MSVRFINLSNPLDCIAEGINYGIGPGGAGTQLQPNVTNGQPVTSTTSYGYTPPYPPFPAASGPGLSSFTIKRGGGSQQLFYQVVAGFGSFSSPCGTGAAFGTLQSGGGTNGAIFKCIQCQSASSGPPGLFGLVLLLPSPASNAFPSNPFHQSTWNSITFTTSGTDSPANTQFTITSASLSFTAGGTQIGGWSAQWGPSNFAGPGSLPNSYTASETLAFTVA